MFFCSTTRFRMVSAILAFAACVLFTSVSLRAQGEQIFKGQITRCSCAGLDQQAATSDKGGILTPCPTATCVNARAKYVLIDTQNKATYQLDKQRKSKAFVGEYVMVMGTLDKSSGTIQVDQVVRALPPKVTAAKSVFIYCDACPRGMAKAKLAAVEELAGWNHFNVLADPKNADLILIFSANPYLGDYVTRDGPDKRPASVDITYMDVVDPRSGEDLWGDSRQWGSMLVSKATKSLISEFRERLEEESSGNQQSFPRK
jgi:hypothetical protein